MSSAVIVAHRGLSALYPENTLPAIEQAIAIGAKAVEFDVQLTADKVPVLFHDPAIARMTGKNGQIMECSWRQLQKYQVAYPVRIADRHAGAPIVALAEIVDYFLQWPSVMPCIEIKVESTEYFGLKTCINRIIKIAEPLIGHAMFLSFSAKAIELLHSMGLRRTGWVLGDYNRLYRTAAEALQPWVLICAKEKLPVTAEGLWPGPWEWMVYQTEDPKLVTRLIRRGVRYIETDNVKIIAESLPQLFTE